MAQTYEFDVRSLSRPDVTRTIELRGDQTLADLQGVMKEEFGLEGNHLWAFYLSGEWHDGYSEFGSSGRAPDAELRSLGLEPGLRIAHLHERLDELWHVVDVTRVGEVLPGAEYPRVTARRGEIEPALPWKDEEVGGEPFAPDMVAEVKSVHRLVREGASARAIALVERIAGLLGYEPFPPALLGEALEAAAAWDELDFEDEIELPASRLAEVVHQLCSAVRTRQRAGELSSLVGRPIWQFLSRAVDQLAAAGRFDEASEAAFWLADADRSPGEIVTVALFQAAANLKAEARALLARAEAMPYAPSAHDAYSIARAYAAAGDDAAAEERLRRLAGRRWITLQDREPVVGLLAEILERTGRGNEARAVEAEHAAWHRRLLEKRGGTVRRTEPRVGRNDPCPCGSGRKFKKCCGAATSAP